MPEEHAPTRSSAKDLAEAIRSAEISAGEVVRECLSRVELDNPGINAFITIDFELVIDRARYLDQLTSRGQTLGSLHGVPVAVKDCIDVAGLPNTCGVAAWRHRFVGRNSSVVTNLLNAGAVILGTTNLHEYALGVTTDNVAYGTAKNPWDRTRIPGGSSGGSAVALAAGMTPLALGTDTGGSIRIPAGLCGVVGLKPTTGVVPVDGVLTLARSFDCVGPMARTVEDLGLLLHAMQGGRSAAEGEGTRADLREYRLGLVKESVASRVSPDISGVIADRLSRLADMGLDVREVSFPGWEEVEDLFSCIAQYEIARVRGATSLPVSGEIRAILEEGQKVSHQDYSTALAARERLLEAVQTLWLEVDILAMPTTPIVAPPLGTDTVSWPEGGGEPLFSALSRLCYPANLLGLPAVTIPCGLVQGLPVGLQLLTAADRDFELLRFAQVVEEAIT